MGAEVSSRFTLSSRQKLLLPLVMIGAFFEGFDFMVINLALPFIQKDMGISSQSASFVISAVAIGALLAFFVVRLADKFGRRPIFIIAVILYSILSVVTAFTKNIETFVAFQLLGRVFLVTCWAVGMVIMSEEFAPELRGRAVGLFQSAAAVGAIFPSVCMMFLTNSSFGWRGLYILGGLPLLLLIFAGKNLPETQAFIDSKTKTAEEKEAGPGFFAVFEAPYIKTIFKIMILWICMYLCYACWMNFFSMRVVNELSWTASQVSLVTAIGALIGLLGYYLVGKSLDSLGRRRTGVIFFLVGMASVIINYQAKDFITIVIAQVLCSIAIGTFTVICATFTNELFPTAIRANATAWGNNIIGRLATIFGPALIGILTAPIGIGNAVTLVAGFGALGCALIVIFLLPETKGLIIPDYQNPQARAL